MTVKLLLFKSGEDVISDIKEMVIGDENDPKVVGYFLNKPCVVKMTQPSNISDGNEDDSAQSAKFKVTLFPWMPLTKDEVIPISTDWVITIVNPTDKLKNMYIEEVINYGKENNQSFIVDKQSDSDN